MCHDHGKVIGSADPEFTIVPPGLENGLNRVVASEIADETADASRKPQKQYQEVLLAKLGKDPGEYEGLVGPSDPASLEEGTWQNFPGFIEISALQICHRSLTTRRLVSRYWIFCGISWTSVLHDTSYCYQITPAS